MVIVTVSLQEMHPSQHDVLSSNENTSACVRICVHRHGPEKADSKSNGAANPLLRFPSSF